MKNLEPQALALGIPKLGIYLKAKTPAREPQLLIAKTMFRGKRHSRSLELKCPPELWDTKTQNVNLKIRRARDEYRGLYKAVQFFRNWYYANMMAPIGPEVLMDRCGVKNLFDAILQNEDQMQADASLATFMREHLDVSFQKNQDKVAYRSWQKRKTVLAALEHYEDEHGVKLEGAFVNLAFRDAFLKWLYDTRGIQAQTAAGYLKTIRTFALAMKKKGREVHYEALGNEFTLSVDPPETFALTTFEVDALWAVRATSEAMQNAVDAFVMNCDLGLRWGDMITLSREGFFEQAGRVLYRFNEEKTKKRGRVITISERAATILESYGWTCPVEDMHNVNFNVLIKDAAKLIPLDREYEYISRFEGKELIETRKICDYIGSHSSRRTFATNAFRRGVSLDVIRVQTGHASDAQLEQYIRTTAVEDAVKAFDTLWGDKRPGLREKPDKPRQSGRYKAG